MSRAADQSSMEPGDEMTSMDPVDEVSTRRRPRAPVMSDVGRLAGVSHQTVSRVINGSPHVRPETRKRVLAAMEELGYRPNSVARALVTGRSKTLGVVSFDTTLYGPASTLFGIERAAHEAGYFIIVASLKALDRPSVADAVERLRRQGVDGILVIAPHSEAGDALLHTHADVPLVAVEAGPDGGVPVVAVDQALRVLRPCGTAPGRRTSSRPASASKAGGRPCNAPAPSCPNRWSGTGARAPATTSAGASAATRP